MSLLQQLAAELDAMQQSKGMIAGYKAGVAGSAPGSPYMHGPGGLFGVMGLERDVISTRIQPIGLASELPVKMSREMLPFFPYLNSYGSPTGSNPSGVCDDPKEAGPVSTCVQTAQFGRYSFQTRTLDITRNNQQINRGEFFDLRVVNGPTLNNPGNGITSPAVNGSPDLSREVLNRMIEVGVAFQSTLIPQLWQGNPANNSAAGGYAEFPGLDILIGTNKFDAFSNVSCPALNSYISNFNYGRIDQGTGGTDIVNTITYMMRNLRHNATYMQLDPATWAIVMREELFYELTAVWPCAYMTYRCSMTNNGVNDLVVNSTDQLQMRDDMRNGKYLLIDGVKYGVTFDMGIHESTNTNNNRVSNPCFASDIYVIPLTVRGGMLSTYWEVLDYSQTAMLALSDGAGGGSFNDFWTDGGRYLWHRKTPVNWCLQWLAMIQPRVILLTPQLAGRVTNVQYCPLQHTRDAFPTDPYFISGGPSFRPGPSAFADWGEIKPLS